MRTWLLAGFVVACLAGAAWLFWSEGSADDGDGRDSGAREDRELAEGVLDVPKDDDADADDGRRGEDGRERLEEGIGGADATTDRDAADAEDEDDADAEDAAEPLPAVFENLAGRRIAVYVASAGQEVGATELVRVGGLRVPCAARSDAARVALEHEQVTAVLDVLRRAGARSTSLDGRDVDSGEAGCVDQRVRALDGAELALVIRAGSNRRTVFAGRPAADASRASRRASAAFAAELAATLGLATPRSPDAQTARLLAEVGAIDLDGGAVVAFLEQPLSDDPDDTEQLAVAIARAMALTAARAPSPAASG